MKRVVEVDDQGRARSAQRGRVAEHIALEHDDIDALTEALHIGTRCTRAAELRALQIALTRAQELDVVVAGEAARHVPRPDRGTRHARGEHVGRHHGNSMAGHDSAQPARLWASAGRSASPSHTPPSDTTPTSS